MHRVYFSARYAGEPSDSQRNIDKLMREMSGKSERSARFRTCIAFISDTEQEVFEGSVEGCIIDTLRGYNGFGYDPLFISEMGPFSQLTAEEKDSISHRGQALRLFKAELQKYL